MTSIFRDNDLKNNSDTFKAHYLQYFASKTVYKLVFLVWAKVSPRANLSPYYGIRAYKWLQKIGIPVPSMDLRKG